MITMILDLGSLSFNSTTSKQQACIFFCYRLWFLELFDNSCLLYRAFWCSWSGGWCGYCKTQQCMYVCMYVLVEAAAIILAFSSSAGALPLLRHDDHHLHITPKASKQASKQVGPILLLLLPHFGSVSDHCAGADMEFSFKDSSVETCNQIQNPSIY